MIQKELSVAACIISFSIGGISSLLITPFASRIKKGVIKKFNNNDSINGNDSMHDDDNNSINNNDSINDNNSINDNDSMHDDDNNSINNQYIDTICCSNIIKYVGDNIDKKLDNIVEENDTVSNIHTQAEKFDYKTEEYFKSLQIFTAMCDSFSHGANDVANAIGPFAAIYMISRDGAVIKEVEMGSEAYWILGFGGVGISLGLLVYGYKIIHAIGLKLCKITPSRGVAIELSSALVIITGSRLEIPLSTTHCQIGATMGVAALEDPKNCSGINWNIVGKTFIGWILTLIVVGSSTALLTAQGTYAPEVGNSDCGEF